MAEIVRRRVLRQADALAGRGDESPESVATMLRYYGPPSSVHARGRVREATEA